MKRKKYPDNPAQLELFLPPKGKRVRKRKPTVNQPELIKKFARSNPEYTYKRYENRTEVELKRTLNRLLSQKSRMQFGHRLNAGLATSKYAYELQQKRIYINICLRIEKIERLLKEGIWKQNTNSGSQKT